MSSGGISVGSCGTFAGLDGARLDYGAHENRLAAGGTADGGQTAGALAAEGLAAAAAGGPAFVDFGRFSFAAAVGAGGVAVHEMSGVVEASMGMW